MVVAIYYFRYEIVETEKRQSTTNRITIKMLE